MAESSCRASQSSVVIPEKTCPLEGGDRGSRNSLSLKAYCFFWIALKLHFVSLPLFPGDKFPRERREGQKVVPAVVKLFNRNVAYVIMIAFLTARYVTGSILTTQAALVGTDSNPFEGQVD